MFPKGESGKEQLPEKGQFHQDPEEGVFPQTHGQTASLMSCKDRNSKGDQLVGAQGMRQAKELVDSEESGIHQDTSWSLTWPLLQALGPGTFMFYGTACSCSEISKH